MPKSETAVMVSTVVVTVVTHNLAYGVVVGVLVAMVLFARRAAHLTEVEDVAELDEDTHVYAVTGALFFATSNDLYSQFDYVGAPRTSSSTCPGPHLGRFHGGGAGRDHTKFESKGKTSTIVGLNRSSAPCTSGSAATSAPVTDRAEAMEHGFELDHRPVTEMGAS